MMKLKQTPPKSKKSKAAASSIDAARYRERLTELRRKATACHIADQVVIDYLNSVAEGNDIFVADITAEISLTVEHSIIDGHNRTAFTVSIAHAGTPVMQLSYGECRCPFLGESWLSHIKKIIVHHNMHLLNHTQHDIDADDGSSSASDSDEHEAESVK